MSDLSQLTSLEHLHACWLKSRICKRRSLRAQTKRLKDLASKANSNAALMARALKKRLKEERK